MLITVEQLINRLATVDPTKQVFLVEANPSADYTPPVKIQIHGIVEEGNYLLFKVRNLETLHCESCGCENLICLHCDSQVQ